MESILFRVERALLKDFPFRTDKMVRVILKSLTDGYPARLFGMDGDVSRPVQIDYTRQIILSERS